MSRVKEQFGGAPGTTVFKEELLSQSGLFKGMHKGMTIASAAMILAFVLFAGTTSELAGSLFGAMRSWIESVFGWYYLVVMGFFIAVCVVLVFTRYGSVRLGDDDSRPDFSNLAWFAMLFSAGIGIGILFFGVAEPIFYLDNSGAFGYPNNPYADMAGASAVGHARAVEALRVTYFHWGFHGWAGYAIVGLSLAYFAYRKKLPLALRSALHPFIGDRIYGPIGHIVDMIGVLGCVFGVATSLGLGVNQMAVGLERLVGVDPGTTTQLVLIGLISIVSILSALSGVGRGIKIISEWNIIISALVVAFFLFGGPTAWLLSMFGESLGSYLVNFLPMGLWFPEEEGPAAWQNGWTVFYWGWWLSWAPFVGLFIARISRGRTLREFVIGVLCVPTFIIFVWMGIFGGSALYQELNAAGGAGTGELVRLVTEWNLPAALFTAADGVAGTGVVGWLLSAMLVFLLLSWFVTSSDSGTLVLTTILSLGNEEPPKLFRIFWGSVIGSVAAVLLVAGGLNALQTVNIAAALPVSVVILLMTLGVLKSLIMDSSEVSESPALPQLDNG
ncbi:BCCT family transporter [Pseudomonas benzenivorans]|uniref:BCCT family transporter n=1 Tax=Pseudomonas benzenivorans TaxID=556533 RepID=A0ABY5H1Z8_9PSED|nr:BCCT family transporter [Pseudomonas benzenivorans]UTW06300.1 BCCT family transporter [Pseudomonas benzenivorans]